MQSNQLFETAESAALPTVLEGFRYQPSIIEPGYEAAVVAQVQELPFREFEFHGFHGKRRVISFGWRYDYAGRGSLEKAGEIPSFLLHLRRLVASFVQVDAAKFEQALVTEYRPGAGIGWHRDKAVFGEVIGVSLLAPCVLRFRRLVNGYQELPEANRRWQRANVLVQPRSAYVLAGRARYEWEHSIRGMDELRYAITFRTLRH